MNNKIKQYEALFTVKDIAKILKIRAQTVYDLVALGKLKSYRLGPKIIRISRYHLTDYLESHKH